MAVERKKSKKSRGLAKGKKLEARKPLVSLSYGKIQIVYSEQKPDGPAPPPPPPPPPPK